MKMQSAVDEYLVEIEVRKYTPKTIRSYRCNLNLFLRFCAEKLHVETVEALTPAVVRQFSRCMSEAGRKGTYINGVLKSIKSFIQYSYEEGYGGFDTRKTFKWCKEEKPVITAFSPEQVRIMLQSCRGHDYLSLRDYAILTLLFETGIRCWELCCIREEDDRRALRERFELDKADPDALDILLFTEVGSEGLDYQFCDTMINYDLPWNPMRIEQRIGRIDRRGQKSEAVNIYNIITADTVDADIYSRCLMRIGIFERSIGECEEVLGAIGAQIEQIAVNTALTDEERRRKLEQMADNEIRRMQELSKLEDEERALFGFDLSNYTAAKEIKDAESPWISPLSIQRLVERYLRDRLGEGQYIIGASELKQIRLSREARLTLLEDFRRLSNIKSSLKRRWENYLKGSEPMHRLTFTSETASKERRAFFITPMHPLVKQAAKYYATSQVSYIHLEYYSEELPEGTYPFSIYAWSYVGLNPMFRVVPICENELLAAELMDILQDANTSTTSITVDKGTWAGLEGMHIALWQREKETYLAGIQSTANYKLESISSNYRNRKRTLEQKIRDAFDEKIRRMYQSELGTATEKYQIKVDEINDRASRADIHTSLIANGIIEIKRG